MDISDTEILQQFKEEGTREKAFTQLVQRDQKRIYWFIRRMVMDHEDANDLVQEVFIKAWGNLEGFRGESSITSWLYRIAVNLTSTFFEKKKRKYSTEPLDNNQADLINQLHSGVNIDADAIQLKLQEAIISLPEKQRFIFQLRYFDEIPYEEMSSILGTSEGALKASYHHAVKKIEEFMRSHD